LYSLLGIDSARLVSARIKPTTSGIQLRILNID